MTHRYVFVFLCLLFAAQLTAQRDSTHRPIQPMPPYPPRQDILVLSCGEKADTIKRYETSPDTLAAFPGGQDSLHAYLARNIKLSDSTCAAKKMYVTFVVLPDGRLVNVKMKTIAGQCADYNLSVINAVCSMPRWQPARRNGQPCITRVSLLVDVNELKRYK